jgi:hypothetical protein
VPPVRFSSLLIRRPDAAVDKSILEGSSDMAQAFESPTGNQMVSR